MTNWRSFLAASRRPLYLAAALAAGSLLLSAAPAGAAQLVTRLSANIPIGALPSACDRAPTGDVCTNAVVEALDGARVDLGLGAYVLPADFDSLSGSDQIFILSNLDRIAYGLPTIAGLSPTLGTAAMQGMLADTDPTPTSLLGSLSAYGWTSNWAGDWANAPYAYYEWMYDDGYGGTETSNLDCTSSSASGCWVHRRNVLAFSSPGTLSMGASVGTDASGQTSYATTLVWTPASGWTSYDYTWAEAQADGAGGAHGGRFASTQVRKHHRRAARTTR